MKDVRGSHLVVTRESPSTLASPGSEDHHKISIRGKGHMKLILTALIALCCVAATFADESKFGPAWVDGHSYTVRSAMMRVQRMEDPKREASEPFFNNWGASWQQMV